MGSATRQNGNVEFQAELVAPVAPAALYPWVADLAQYPRWLDLVANAEAEDRGVGELAAWAVTLTARLGPFRRSKRLRMVRVLEQEPSRLEFVRREADGRAHSVWRLSATLQDTAAGTRLSMGLYYGGTLWVPMLEGLLGNQVETGRDRLVALAVSEPQ